MVADPSKGGASRLRGTTRAAFVAGLVALFPAPSTLGDDGLPNGRHGPLDGKSFSGDFGPEGRAADRTDTIHFGEGKVWSEACVPCGFAPAPYWVRHEGDAIHFQAELHSPTSGTFVYEGVVRDGQIRASMSWQKDRWYWSISRDFWFEGTLAEVEARQSPASVTLLAAASPEACEP